MNKIYINNESIIVLDPTPEIIGFLKGIDPSYEIKPVFHQKYFVPKFQESRKIMVDLDHHCLSGLGLTELLEVHNKVPAKNTPNPEHNSITFLDLKKEIAFRQMRQCGFCAHKCKTNRYVQKGLCGLDHKAYHAKPFIHIGEEDVINPALVVNFAGCSMNCVFCIDTNIKNPEKLKPLNIKEFWSDIEQLSKSNIPPNTLEFAGGNPTESLPWVCEILHAAPSHFNLPIVWNSNLYTAKASLNLLDNIVDVYLPDFTFGNDECAKRLAAVDNYWEIASKAVDEIINLKAKIIFRILVLPNHVKCCHEPVLRYLSNYRNQVWVSILDQYVPEHMAYLQTDINRRPTKDEISEVERLAREYGLRNIASDNGNFWNAQGGVK